MYRRLFLLIVIAAALTACVHAPTERLTPTSNAIRAVRVFAWGSDDPVVASPAHESFVATLQRSGLETTQIVTLQRPFEDLKALERSWSEAPAGNAASHALVLTRQYQQTGYVRYEAVLWDASSRKLVWKGTLASAATFDALRLRVMPKDAAKRAERLAADVLRGLDRDGLFPLHGKVPRDAQGEEISPTLLPLQLL